MIGSALFQSRSSNTTEWTPISGLEIASFTSTEDSFEIITTGRLADAPGGEEFDDVQATVITSQAELDAQWPSWENETLDC